MFKSILVPIDIAHPSSWRAALPQAIEFASASQGKLTAMTVIPDIRTLLMGVQLAFQLEKLVADARGALARIIADHATDGIAIETEVRTGSIGGEILRLAKERDADLILMASHRPEMLDYLIGPNAAHVAQHADCSVLVLRRYAVPRSKA